MLFKKRSFDCKKKYFLNNGIKNEKKLFKEIYDVRNNYTLNNFKFIFECVFDSFGPDMHFDNIFKHEKPSILKKLKKNYLEKILLKTTKKSVIDYQDLNFLIDFQRGDYFLINIIFCIFLVAFFSFFIAFYFDKNFKELIEENSKIKKNK